MLLQWSFEVSTIGICADKLSKLHKDLPEDTTCAEYKPHVLNINTHLQYTSIHPDILKAPDSMTAIVLDLQARKLLENATRRLLADRMPVLAEVMIPQDADTLSSGLGGICAGMYPEFMLQSIASMKGRQFLFAVERLFMGVNAGRIHTVPECIRTAAQQILDHLRTLDYNLQDDVTLWGRVFPTIIGCLVDQQSPDTGSPSSSASSAQASKPSKAAYNRVFIKELQTYPPTWILGHIHSLNKHVSRSLWDLCAKECDGLLMQSAASAAINAVVTDMCPAATKK